MKQLSITDAQPEILRILKIRTASMKKDYVFENKTGRPGECLICVIKGSAVYNTEQNEFFSLKQGSVLFLNREIKYSMKVTDEEYDFIFVEFQLSSEPYTLKNQLFSPENPETLFRLLIETDVKKQHSRKISCLSILYRIYELITNSSAPQNAASFKHAQIERVVYEIHQNFNDSSYSLYETSKKLNISEAYLRRLFNSEYDMSPARYLVSLRISHAKNLLTYQNISVSEVAIQSGFSDIYYFSRRFKKETGMTPTEYKRYINSY